MPDNALTEQQTLPTLEPPTPVTTAPRSRTRATPGPRRDYTLSLPPALIADIDEIAATRDTTRAKMVELALRAGINACKRASPREDGEPA
jgi:hypothetical protein